MLLLWQFWGMRLPMILLSCSMGFTGLVPAAESIYSPVQPELFHVWTRVADFSPRLRAVEAAELSPNARLAASGSKFGYKVMLWRVVDGTLVWEAEHESEVECVVFSPDGLRLASGGEDFFVRLWDVKSGEAIAAWEHPSGLDGITWSNQGHLIATGAENGDLFLWDADSYAEVGRVNLGSTINSLRFTEDDSRIVVGGNIQTPDPETGQTKYDGFAKLVDAKSLKTLVEYEGHGASVKSVRLSPDEKHVATGGFDHTARVYDLESGRLLKVFEQSARVEAVEFSAEGHFLVVGGHEKAISFYRMKDWSLAHKEPSPRTEYVDFSDDGRLMLTAHEDSGLIQLFLMGTDTQQKAGFYQRIANEQLNNRDLK